MVFFSNLSQSSPVGSLALSRDRLLNLSGGGGEFTCLPARAVLAGCSITLSMDPSLSLRSTILMAITTSKDQCEWAWIARLVPAETSDNELNGFHKTPIDIA